MKAIAMCIVFCAVGLFQAAAAKPPAVIVQLVDGGWLPLPNMSIAVTRVESCAGKKDKGSGAARIARSDLKGYASFSLERGSYVVAAGGEGNFERKRICLPISGGSSEFPTAYVQVQLTPASHVEVR